MGLPVCRSLLHFGRGRYQQVLDELLPIRTRVHEFGGSHAQRDAVERTLLEAAIRAGRTDLALALVSERLAVRDGNTYAWSKRAGLLAAAADRPGRPRPRPGPATWPADPRRGALRRRAARARESAPAFRLAPRGIRPRARGPAPARRGAPESGSPRDRGRPSAPRAWRLRTRAAPKCQISAIASQLQ